MQSFWRMTNTNLKKLFKTVTMNYRYILSAFGGVAQWLGHQSLASGVSLQSTQLTLAVNFIHCHVFHQWQHSFMSARTHLLATDFTNLGARGRIDVQENAVAIHTQQHTHTQNAEVQKNLNKPKCTWHTA